MCGAFIMAKKYLFIDTDTNGDTRRTSIPHDVLDHISYDSVSDRVISTKPIETTLNSYYVGNQHRLSSGGTSLFIHSESNGHIVTDLTQGFKDQSIPANHDETGLIPPIVSTNISDLHDPLGFLNLTPDYSGIFSDRTTIYPPAVFPGYSVNFGFSVISAQILYVGDEIHYSVTDIDSGVEIYNQVNKITVQRPVDYLFDWMFSNPLILAIGSNLSIDTFIRKPNGDEEDWDRRTANEIPGGLYQAGKARTFEYTEVANVNGNQTKIIDDTATTTHTRDSTYLADTTNGLVTIDIFDHNIAPFTVRDMEKKFHQNSVLVNIYNPDGVTIDHTATLDVKDSSVLFFKVDSIWYYSEEGFGATVGVSSDHIQSMDFDRTYPPAG
jgi:hypothetical protein